VNDWREAWRAAERVAFGMHPAARPDAHLDRYGEGELTDRVTTRVATLLGKESAVWMPSGTMAQQIALRIHAERRGRSTVGFHPYCHLDTHEERGYAVLHGLRPVLLANRERLIEPADVEAAPEPLGSLLLELPQRDLGGLLPAWDDLVATCDAARERGAALHLDGARLWQCEPFYERPLADIAAPFDTVYVSFYKDLGAPAGCALAGPADVIAEAKVWQVRHGGRMFGAAPYLLAAERGLDEVLPRMPQLVAHARAAAAALDRLEGVTVVPSLPQTAMFHVLVRRPLDAFNDALVEVGRGGIWAGPRFSATEDPTTQRAEITVTTDNLDVPVDDAIAVWREALSRSSPAAR
jgi:threonine aldolase